MTKSTKSKPEPARVEVLIPRGGEREDPNLFVGINGVSYLLPKGKRSQVPTAVAWEIERSEHARDALDETMSRLRGATA